MPSSGMNLITTVIGFGMSATFIVFVCTRIICGRLRSSHSNSPNYEIESRVDLEQQVRNNGCFSLNPDLQRVICISVDHESHWLIIIWYSVK